LAGAEAVGHESQRCTRPQEERETVTEVPDEAGHERSAGRFGEDVGPLMLEPLRGLGLTQALVRGGEPRKKVLNWESMRLQALPVVGHRQVG
jgi:hypothetical protein